MSAPEEASSTISVSVSLASTDVLPATLPATAWPALSLYCSKLTPVSTDADLDSIKTDSSAQPAPVDASAALDPTSASSAEPEDSPTMVSATILVLQDQSPPTTQPPVSTAMLPAPPASSTHPSVPPVPHAVAHSSTSNVLLLALLEPTPSMELANSAPTAVLLVLDQTLPVLAAPVERSSSTEPATTNAPSS